MEEEIQSLKNKLQELELKKQEKENRKKDPFRYLKQRIEKWENNRKQYIDNYEYHMKNCKSEENYKQGLDNHTEHIECDKSILDQFTKQTLQISNLIAYSKELEQRIDKLEKQLINTSDIDLLDIESL